MEVSIFGLGYVGAVMLGCLARDGHKVIGVDVNPHKVELLLAGESPIVEPGLPELLAAGVKAGTIQATTDVDLAVEATAISLISVGTPPDSRGEPDLSYVFGVFEQIARALVRKGKPHTVVLRSTSPPGTLDRCRRVFRELAPDIPVYLATNPEFLREGSAIKDYDAPPYTLIGTTDTAAEQVLRELYAHVQAPFIIVKPAVAEMVKYAANTWHATKIAFANEIGRMAKAFGVDGRETMSLIAQDHKLNVSAAYMRPGFAYGGSCLPKDVGALLAIGKALDVPLPLLSALPTTNNTQIELAVQQVLMLRPQRVLVLGLAFKPGTDDLRESPAVPLVKRLLGEGCAVEIYDRSVQHARLLGTNRDYIQANLPHFNALLIEEPAQALKSTDVVVVTYSTSEFRELLQNLRPGTRVVDLAGLYATPPEGVEYHSLAW